MGDGMRNRMRGRGGFTLIEILIVISIVGFMVTIASTNVMSWMDHSSAVGFWQEFLSRCADARTRAMASN
ncbi:MAG: type II secretion system protein, partial [Deltaproteobacteria bacterium]|nr:type II secretion system protein [Deltaproteobacteria bacterium]